MKILQLVTKRQFRGAEVFAANLSSELIALGHHVIFAGLYKNTGNEELRVERAENLDLVNQEKKLLSPGLVRQLVKLIKKEKPQIVQCNGSDTLKYMAAASFFVPNVPFIYRNISMISKWIDSRFQKMLYSAIFSRVSHISSVGNEAAEDFLVKFGFNPAKISVIRRGIPIREVKEIKVIEKYKEELHIKEGDKVAVHIGNFSPEKNHQFLLDVFEKLRDKQIKLICVGTGEKFDQIQKGVEQRNLHDTVVLLGFRKDIPEILAVADCFVLCSLVEGVPGVILEAGAQRTPSVATDVGGVSEVLIDGKTGYLIKNFDKTDFTEKMLKILEDEKLKKELGENAFNLVQEEFNPIVNAEKFEKLYSDLILEAKM